MPLMILVRMTPPGVVVVVVGCTPRPTAPTNEDHATSWSYDQCPMSGRTGQAYGCDMAADALTREASELDFEHLVREHRDALARYCRRLGVRPDGVDDVVQQAFLSAWSALGRGAEVEAVRPWLYGIVRNEAFDAHRRTRVQEVPLPETLLALDTPDADSERSARVGETLRELRALPAPQRDALLGTAVHGRSHHAVATDLGVTDTAVRGLVYRARATLRAAVGAIVPSPVFAWIARLLAAGGEAPAALKGVAVVAAAGALAGGTTAVVHDVRGAAPARSATSDRGAAASGAAGVLGGASVLPPGADAGRGGPGSPGDDGAAGGRGRGGPGSSGGGGASGSGSPSGSGAGGIGSTGGGSASGSGSPGGSGSSGAGSAGGGGASGSGSAGGSGSASGPRTAGGAGAAGGARLAGGARCTR